MTNAIDSTLLSDLGLTKQQPTRKANSDLGQDAFMKLIITQLQNQDPLKPMDNTQFLSQLAQFKSVTGLEDLRKSVESMATSLQSNQALQASSLVGRWVEVPSSKAELWKDAGMAGSVDVPSNASQVTVTIKDSSGMVVKQIQLGAQQAGTANFSWDGTADNGSTYSPGEYSIEAAATIGSQSEAIDTNAIVPVDSVVMGKAGDPMTINTSLLGNVKLSDVKQIM
jgi:flagellar basal-body rod modification protein FlgD